MGISTLVFSGAMNDDNLASAFGRADARGDAASIWHPLTVCMANGGVRVAPSAIIRVVDRNGNVLEEHILRETQVISEKTAYVITNMLESAVLRRISGNAYIGRPMAGKTGMRMTRKMPGSSATRRMSPPQFGSATISTATCRG